MFKLSAPIEKTGLDNAIENLLADMSGESSDSEEYAKMVAQLAKLYPLKDAERPKTISPDVVATVSANLLGIALILWHERAGIVTSKALTFVMKLR